MARQVKVREVSETSELQRTARQTDILTSTCGTRKVRGHKLSSRKEMQSRQLLFICKVVWIPITIELETLILSHDFVAYLQLW